MTAKLHVANLSPHVTDNDLLDRFSRFGRVAFAAVTKDELSGDSRGIGLVEMADSTGAAQAIKWLNFSSIEGQIIAVSTADSGQFSS